MIGMWVSAAQMCHDMALPPVLIIIGEESRLWDGGTFQHAEWAPNQETMTWTALQERYGQWIKGQTEDPPALSEEPR